MSARNPFPLVAVDIGNNRIKFGLFESDAGEGLPQPGRTLQIGGDDPNLDQIASWLRGVPPWEVSWWIGSVNRPATTRLLDWLRAGGRECRMMLLACGDLPLRAALARPDMVGIDRLLDAVAANYLRQPGRPAIVIDIGTAITVDVVSAEGAFLGGAIGPGVAMSARALHAFTDLLPWIDVSELGDPPPAVGTSTVSAMQSGLFWGMVGAIRELILRMAKDLAAEPEVFLTGGASPAVAELLGPAARHVPHLTLAGIALAARAAR